VLPASARDSRQTLDDFLAQVGLPRASLATLVDVDDQEPTRVAPAFGFDASGIEEADTITAVTRQSPLVSKSPAPRGFASLRQDRREALPIHRLRQLREMRGAPRPERENWENAARSGVGVSRAGDTAPGSGRRGRTGRILAMALIAFVVVFAASVVSTRPDVWLLFQKIWLALQSGLTKLVSR
jgi:hypothetical protein